MTSSRFWWRLVGATAGALITTAALSSQPAPLGIPAGVLSAKTVFVSNGGSDAGLFPEPFSGDPNRPYFGFMKGLQGTAVYELVDDPAKADLVMEIQLSAPAGPVHTSKQLGSADALPFFRLTIYDRKTHYVLWTITEPIEFAILQKTHDRNFDEALGHVVDDLQALSKPGAAGLYPHPPARQPWSQ